MSKLAAILETEVSAEIEQIQAQAREEAARIVREAEAQAQELLQSKERQLQARRAAELTRARSTAQLSSTAQRLSASDSQMARAFALAEEQLEGIRRVPQYREILARLLREAREALPTATVAQTHPDDVALLSELATGLDVEPNPSIKGGVRLLAQGGKSGLTNTLTGRLERLKPALAPKVSAILQPN